ncbi:TonB-dependent receptor [Belliella sp. DSM 111904]|uniref:TonB-dependent receptor n=1 Tax=Belliella filtrata TaxID=2923435 RepID=A0ABS9UVT1_9BACT|nr:TonB-dependent receptor [Belliella filtrata]MCH7408273.1 TonB-dependent receptor [Belliella filtrata]
MNYKCLPSMVAMLVALGVNNTFNSTITYASNDSSHVIELKKRDVTVRGVVVSGTDQEQIPGVSVLVKGTTIGVATDIDGAFTINVPDENSVLIFSFVGYKSQEVQVGSRSLINITLEEDLSSLEEVVVVGYGTQTKATVTGAIGEVRKEDLALTPSVTTGEALVGRVQGVTFRQGDARPGSSVSLQIRNMGQPLYVIDGIPSEAGQFNNLGQNDIESISILKDGAAAIYGMRAANGVVIVTTKRGKMNTKPQININSYYGAQNFTRFPRPANAYQFVRAQVESDVNLTGTTSWTPDELERWRLGEEPGYQSTDYYDFIMRPNVPQYNLNASAAGGSEGVKYFFSVNHLNQDALLEDFNFRRTNFQSNIEMSLTDGLTVGAQISGRLETRDFAGVPGLDDYFNPFLSVFAMWPTERPYANDNPNYVNADVHNINVNPATYRRDITGFNVEEWRSMRGNFFAEYDFGFGLTAKGTYSYTFTNLDFDGFEYTYDAYRYDEETDTYLTRPEWGNQNPWRERRKRNIQERVAQFQLDYNKSWNGHNLQGVLGYERWDNQQHYMVVHTVPPNNYIPIMSFADQDVLIDEIFEEAREGYFGRLNYNYREKYLVELIARYDGSFLFAPGSRFGFFPSASVGWRLSDERFMEGLKGNWLENLKIRASIGQMGSDRLLNNSFLVNPFSYFAGYDFRAGAGGSAVLDGSLVQGVDPRGLPITTLSWIVNTNQNIGIDMSLFRGKVNASFDAFARKRTGLPAARYDVLLPNEVGYGLPAENLESDVQKGIEGMVGFNGRMGKVDFEIAANATFARAMILDRYRPRFSNSWNQYRSDVEGRWQNIRWGYEIDGRFTSQEQIDNYPVDIDGRGNRTLLPGDFIFRDVNGDGVINHLDERPIGYAEGANPYVSYGLNGNFKYKGFNLAFNFAGGSMQTFNRYWELRYPFQNNGNSPDFMFEDRWHREDPFDPNSEWIPGHYPAIRRDFGNVNYNRHSTFWQTNIRYMRLRNLEVGYQFPQTIMDKFFVQQMRVYVNGTNLFSIDNVGNFGIDPEIGSANGLVYPQQRIYTLGLNLTL